MKASRWLESLLLLFMVLTPSMASAQKSISDGVDELASKLATSFGGGKQGRVAIIPFRTLAGNENMLGSFIAETFTNSFFSVGYRNIVERQMLDRAIRELRLQFTGMIDPASARKIGKFVNADFVVGGTMTDQTADVVVTCRMFATETGEIVAVAQTRLLKDDNVKTMMATPAEGQSKSSKPYSQPDAPNLKTVTASPTTQPSTSSSTVEEAGFRFVLQKCTRSTTSATCRLLITNNGKERKLSVIYPLVPVPNHSRIVDSTGSQYGVNSIYIGGSLEAVLPTDLTISAVLSTPIDEDSTALNLLEVELFSSGGGSDIERVLARFRNVALSR
jgi:TolB-like protein